jgi:RNA polymerase sigma factor (sigma-70 family)
MITPNTIMTAEENSDSNLVARSLAGDRDAFSCIVSRYQTLICSLAYSRIGNLGQSEDIAQETFITAWKHLRHLREPSKLRAWLCGIVRNRVHKNLRRDGLEPAHQAETLEVAEESPASDALPSDHAVQHEEEAILWRSLERIPELYREPMILFYREHQSVENVAQALDLSEDTVKQRLSRGRRLLHQEVLAFVETTLERTNPGTAFTITVLATIPLLTTSAKAATVATVAVKGGAAVKGATAVGMISGILGPLLGFIGPWFQYRAFLAAADSEDKRRYIRSYYRRLFSIMVAFGVLLVGLILAGQRFASSHPALFAGALIVLVMAYVIAAVRMGAWANRMIRELREESEPEIATQPRWEYRSKLQLLGLPLIHFRFSRTANQRTPVKAWIAGGDFAYGLVFAFGGLAIAPISVGGIAIGLVPFGGLALGLFALGGFAVGGWVFGGFALGWQAFGGCALALNAAMGGVAIARDFASGGIAQAAQANNEMVSQFMKTSPFFTRMEILSHYIGWLNLLWLIPVISWWRILKKRAAVRGNKSAC